MYYTTMYANQRSLLFFYSCADLLLCYLLVTNYVKRRDAIPLALPDVSTLVNKFFHI
jgi:hypothetical protein